MAGGVYRCRRNAHRRQTVDGVALPACRMVPRPFAVVGFTVAHGRIAAIDLIIDPEKLDRIVLGA